MQFRDAPTERIIKNKLTFGTLGRLLMMKFVFVHDFRWDCRNFGVLQSRRVTDSDLVRFSDGVANFGNS
tara:strand:+ start:375 stop:581 length:207 start_codon:yes stop_codon:yes gene_type:complete